MINVLILAAGAATVLSAVNGDIVAAAVFCAINLLLIAAGLAVRSKGRQS